MNNKSKLLDEIEWAYTLVKYSPRPNYDEVLKHINNAQQQLKILNMPVVVGRSEQFCECKEDTHKIEMTVTKCSNCNKIVED